MNQGIDSSQSIENQIEKLEQHFFVGREQEIALFESYLNNPSLLHRIINIYGTGGMGKSYLLEELCRRTLQQGPLFILIDSRDFAHTAESFSKHLLRLLCCAYSSEGLSSLQQDDSPGMESDLQNIQLLTANKRLIIALDTYEELGSLDYWIRETFMVKLNQQVLFIVSGRLPLQNAWSASPAWARLILRVPLGHFDYTSAVTYLHRCALTEEDQGHVIWSITKGHPLTLSLLAATAGLAPSLPLHQVNHTEVLPYVIQRWLQEVPEEALRILVETAAVARHFNQEFLAAICERSLSQNEFDQLTRLSFVRRIEHGWILHDMVRNAIQHELNTREPQRFATIRRNCVMYYYAKIIGRVGTKQLSWESSELFYYMSNSVIRSSIYDETDFIIRFETLREGELTEAKAYMAQRKLHPKGSNIKIFNSNEKRIIDYSLTPEQNLLTLKPLENIDELLTLGTDIVKVARNERGEIVGLSAIIPIHQKTVPYLRENPFSRAYFSHLSDDDLACLSQPEAACAGWFIQMLDVADFGNVAQRNATAYQFLSYLLAGGLLVATPPPFPYLRDIHHQLGMEYLPEMLHYDYGVEFPGTGYAIDTRGEKLAVYLSKLIGNAGISIRKEMSVKQEKGNKVSVLTPREQEITLLLIEGATNNEIASTLFVSEISIKKHLTSIFRKYDVKNRTHLAKYINDNHRKLE
jgi:DNA-binding CsgD family transcriptional regulator